MKRRSLRLLPMSCRSWIKPLIRLPIFLMLGSQDEVVSAQLADKELLKLFKQVEQLSQEDKHLVKTFIDAFVTKRQVQELAK